MLNIPVIRWGKPYESLETEEVVHFATGEATATVGQAGAGIVKRDMRLAQKARDVLREFQPAELIERCKQAANLFTDGTLPMGDGTQTPEEFVHAQSASTGLPEHMCRANMLKNHKVLSEMDAILDALTRGLDLGILNRGYGQESRGVTVSYQAASPVLGAVLPSNSPGVHALWLPVIPLQMGLVLKPGAREPWTPYRIAAAFVAAGIPAEAISIYSGREAGNAVLEACERSMIFGDTSTIERYHGNPCVQAHGPGFSKILLGDDVVDRWEEYLDLMVESIYSNSGRSCINASGVWASRHTKEIAAALAERLGPIEVKAPKDPEAGLAAFTVPNMASAVWKMIEQDLKQSGVTDMTAEYGARLVEQERCAYLRPMIVHCASPECDVASKEYMFPFASVVECPQDEMLSKIGSTLVCSVISKDEKLRRAAIDSTDIDRLNLGAIPTNRLNWLQPHEGNLVEFLYRSRALQLAEK